ncbi:MAG: type IV pilus biogenesis/stability protein PilW [Polaromonas sp.]|uniref:type IV pilus biogenesis/stability protein PilW n=1 Tax=Polaromonas sp. TaxID=1869339 RepID=UPI0025FE3C5F|nr:type IV pilus biogenesis/stability protein PilW [Polaromonas sp.]MBI2724713.1 type IV pilus biogenesis/stability protein PilW [Polaromonas sp.]
MKILRSALMLVCWGTVLLAGCAGNTGGVRSAADGKTDMVTESDEPATRRRARLRLELASGYFEQGQTNVALDELKQALVIDPGFADAYNLRGLVYMRLNDAPLAEDSFRRALAINPRDADVAHNYGWFLCQQSRFRESSQMFAQAIANPTYGGQARSLMAQGVCQVRAGQRAEAEESFTRSYQIDAGNPLTGYNLASLLYDRGELVRAQFYIRRLNNSALANAETLWLGIKIEQRLNNREVVSQLGDQLKRRYAQSKEAASYERGAFNE